MLRRTIFILWILLGLLYLWIKMAYDQDCCVPRTETLPVGDSIEQVETPYFFNQDYDALHTSLLFEDFMDSVFKNFNASDTIGITGWQYSNEPKMYKGLPLGIYRAKLFALRLLNMGIKGPFKLMTLLKHDTSYNYSNSHKAWYNPNIIEFIPTITTVETVEDRQLIYHFKDSDSIVQDIRVLHYLQYAFSRISDSGERLVITGHTDNVEGKSRDTDLGRLRAQKVANYFLDRGIPSSKIIIRSNASKYPIAPNDTEENRKINRRTSIEILSK